MSIVIRFCDKSCQIREELIQFLECVSGTSGQELYLKIVIDIRDLGLEVVNLRGQSYNGAGNTAGKKKWCIFQIFKTQW